MLDGAVDACDRTKDGEQQRSEQQVMLGDIFGDTRRGRVHWGKEETRARGMAWVRLLCALAVRLRRVSTWEEDAKLRVTPCSMSHNREPRNSAIYMTRNMLPFRGWYFS